MTILNQFQKKIRSKEMKISVVGLGYVGLPLAMEFAKKGFCVLGIDTDKDRIDRIKSRQSYITDVPDKELKAVLRKGTLDATTSFKPLKDIDIIIICVPTPLKMKYQPDISFVREAIKSVAENMKQKSLIILESTTYPGTTEEVILPIFEKKGLKHGKDFYLCFSPERIDPGNKAFPVQKIAKIVGGVNNEAAQLAKIAYEAVIAKVVPISSVKVAETAKLLENTFRLVNIALIDEITMMAEKLGINIWEVIDAAKTKPFGFMPFYPGPGVGGFCIPKDPMYLYWTAKKFGFKSRFIKLSQGIISSMPGYVVQRLEAVLKKRGKLLRGASILVCGVTYKRDVKDLRKSPALDIIQLLQRSGSKVSYYDPMIPYLKLDGINLKNTGMSRIRTSKFDCALITTDHTGVDYSLILDRSSFVFDTRNVFKGKKSDKIYRL
ncbi:MAG: nucleotide sugar dehydrogenase [Candidatus Omnitrophica bacterium]|nr:nucleotide sugar dehydrogenase [Candidatus Omnitrophota bacterium]